MAKGKKLELTTDERKKCNGIIHSATVVATAAATGIAQIPLADSAVITPIQIGMIISLGSVFNQVITKETAKGILSAAAASFVGRGVSQVLVGWIPGVGNAVNGGTAAAITEAIGWMAVDRFKQSASALRLIAENDTLQKQAAYDVNSSSENDESEQEDIKQAIARAKRTREDELIKEAQSFIDGTKDLNSNKDRFRDIYCELEAMRFSTDYEHNTKLEETIDALFKLA